MKEDKNSNSLFAVSYVIREVFETKIARDVLAANEQEAIQLCEENRELGSLNEKFDVTPFKVASSEFVNCTAKLK